MLGHVDQTLNFLGHVSCHIGVDRVALLNCLGGIKAAGSESHDVQRRCKLNIISTGHIQIENNRIKVCALIRDAPECSVIMKLHKFVDVELMLEFGRN